MEANELAGIIFNELTPKMQNHDGLAIFAKHRAKFEGWFKAELCDTLSKHTTDITPEKGRIDIVFDDWGLELKTVNTNYRYAAVENKTRPITKNVTGVIEDIEKLAKANYRHKAVVFAVFPAEEDKKEWQEQLGRISKSLRSRPVSKQFRFRNGIPALIYFGTIGETL